MNQTGDDQIDDGDAVHYSAVAKGTPVYSSEGTRVGVVAQIVDNYREHIFDGVVIRTESGRHVFCDAPEVKRTAERGVTLAIEASAVDSLPTPDPGVASFAVNRGAGRIARVLGRGWKRRR